MENQNKKLRYFGFHHAALSSADFDKSLKFYLEGLGCTLVRSWGEGTGRAAMINIGDGGILEIFANGTKEAEQNARWVHFAFSVSDTDEAFRCAVEAGATVKDEPKDVTIMAKEGPLPVRIAFVYGPDGEVLEFFCLK